MPDNILEKIIKKKIERIDLLKKSISLKSLDEKIDQNRLFIDFKDKIQKNIDNNKISLIAEIKKASPSAGIIIEDYDPIEIAKIYYNNKATCLSILTEENFFLGNLIHVSKVKEKINLPVLCKDFFIDKFQVHLAKSYGADAILIIIAGVSDEIANDLYEEALKLNMSIIVEVHTVVEAKKALHFKEALIGINNRNLKSFKTDLKTTINICNTFNLGEKTLICESGINNKEDINYIFEKTKISNFLIGESLIRSPSIYDKMKELIA